jgi:phosphatidylserine/phosphatidylglycerophosphate/cardiolipin synthase-like enzyme
MFIRVQRACQWLFLIAALCAASLPCLGTSSAVLVRALIGDPDDTVYCQAVLEIIAEAEKTIDVLLSSVSTTDNPILPALAEAAGRGIEIRALLDASDWASDITAKNQPTLSYFLESGIEAKFDDPAVTLHSKLVVVDGATVILGSSNWNHYALTEHRQADVLIREAAIGTFYADYFDVLWGETLSNQDVELELPEDFGTKPAVLPLADLPDSASYAHVLLQLLEQAERSIHVAMYRMSYYSGYADSLANDLLQALIDAARRGLDVKVLLDDCAYYEDSAEANLMSAIVLQQRGVDVRLDDPSLTTHCKLVVIDGETVSLGSTNWNYYSLEKNCETDVVFVRLPEVATPFEAYFQTLWTSGHGLTL